MSQRDPEEIWEESLDEGERRLKRSTMGLAASGFAGGTDVTLGILATTVVTGAVAAVTTAQLAHVAGALVFGIAFALITVGRAELFTENFHIPVGAVFAKRAGIGDLLKMWVVTLVLNLAALALFLWLLSVPDVLSAETRDAAGPSASLYAERPLLAAFASAIVAGTAITVFTWATHAADSGIVRVVLCLLVGFVLVAPSLNHAVVAFGKVLFGLFTDTTVATATDLWRNLAVATAGNLIGGVGVVFLTRLAQVRGEPGNDGSGQRPD